MLARICPRGGRQPSTRPTPTLAARRVLGGLGEVAVCLWASGFFTKKAAAGLDFSEVPPSWRGLWNDLPFSDLTLFFPDGLRVGPGLFRMAFILPPWGENCPSTAVPPSSGLPAFCPTPIKSQSKYGRPYPVCHNYSTLPLWQSSDLNEPGYVKTLLMAAEI